MLNMDAEVEISMVRFRVHGQAEVANARDTGNGVYRVGLRFLDVSWERLDSAEQEGAGAASGKATSG